MMRILPGTIRECSGPKVSVTGNAAGYHPGEKVTTGADFVDPWNIGMGLGDGVAALARHGHVIGASPVTSERFQPMVPVKIVPDDYYLNYEFSALSFVANMFLTGVSRIGDPDPYPSQYNGWPFDMGGHAYGPIEWGSSGSFVYPIDGFTTVVAELFGERNSLAFGYRFPMPLNGGSTNKHIPMFY